jgi:hypothetical protein
MSRTRLVLLGLLLVWMTLAWPNLEEQWNTTREAWSVLGPLSWQDRNAFEWKAGYQAVQEIANQVPPGACVAVLTRTAPDKLAYYQARFPYYLYPRRLKFNDAAGCDHVALLREDGAAGERPAGKALVFQGQRVEIYR